MTDPAPWEIAVEEDPGPSPFGVGRVYIAPSFSKLSSLVLYLYLSLPNLLVSLITSPSPPALFIVHCPDLLYNPE